MLVSRLESVSISSIGTPKHYKFIGAMHRSHIRILHRLEPSKSCGIGQWPGSKRATMLIGAIAEGESLLRETLHIPSLDHSGESREREPLHHHLGVQSGQTLQKICTVSSSARSQADL